MNVLRFHAVQLSNEEYGDLVNDIFSIQAYLHNQDEAKIGEKAERIAAFIRQFNPTKNPDTAFTYKTDTHKP